METIFIYSIIFYLSVEYVVFEVVNLQTILKTWVCCYFLNLVSGFL